MCVSFLSLSMSLSATADVVEPAQQLLRPSYPGSMSQVAKNLNNVVFVLDLSQPVSLALITENVKQFVSRGIPIRFGVVPLVSPLGAEDAVETHLAQLLWYLTDVVGRGPAISFLASLQKAANGQRVTVELARRKYEQVAGRLPPIDGGELASYDEVQKGVGRYKASASHSRLNKARQYLRRLGVALPNSLEEEDDELAQPGSFFMNGAYFPLDDVRPFSFKLPSQNRPGRAELTHLPPAGLRPEPAAHARPPHAVPPAGDLSPVAHRQQRRQVVLRQPADDAQAPQPVRLRLGEQPAQGRQPRQGVQ